MARTRWPPGPVNPGLLPRPGRSDRQRRWVPRTGARPTDRYQDNPSGVGRFAGQAGTRSPTLRPHHRKTAEAGPGALTHILPADYLLFGGMAGMALPCSDRPILRVFGPCARRVCAALVGYTLSVGHEDHELSGSGLSVAPGMAQGLDPRAGTPGAPPPGSPPGEGVPTLASHRVATAASGRPCTDGGRRGAEKERRAFTPCTPRATLGLPLEAACCTPGLQEGIRSGLQEGRTNDGPSRRHFHGVACLSCSPCRSRARQWGVHRG